MVMVTRLRSGAGIRRNYRKMAGLRSKRASAGRARLARPVAKAVARVAKRVMSRNTETKYATHVVEANVNHNSAIGAGDFVTLLPQIATGTNDNQKIGDAIRPIKLAIRGLLSMDRGYCDTNQVLMARVLILTSKAVKANGLLPPFYTTFANGLLRPNFDVGPTQIPFVGNQNELFYPVDSEQFVVHYDRVFKISPTSGGDPNGVEENPASVLRWSKVLKCPAVLKYTDSVTTPNNFAPFMAIGYAFADGTGPDVVTTRLISNVESCLYYKDA